VLYTQWGQLSFVGSAKKESIDINILYKGESDVVTEELVISIYCDLFDIKLNLHSIVKSGIAEKYWTMCAIDPQLLANHNPIIKI
jgi:hypothetical protein